MRLLNSKKWYKTFGGIGWQDYYWPEDGKGKVEKVDAKDAQLMSSAEAIMQDALMQIRCMLDRQVCGNDP